MNHHDKKLYLYAFTYLVTSLLLIGVVTFAWFTLTNHNKTFLVSDIAKMESEYAFYIYEEPYRLGNSNPNLVNQKCEDEGFYCYRYVEDPMQNLQFEHSTAPGQRYSFAIKILSQGLTQSYLSFHLGGVVSEGFEQTGYKIETAFYYQVKKISYVIEEAETEDYKAIGPRMIYEGHFDQGDIMYPLAKNLPTLDIYTLSSEMIIYFDLYFDPMVRGYDGQVKHEDSHVFLNQRFYINHLFMTLSLNME